MKVEHVSRGYITIRWDDRVFRIHGEGLLPTADGPGYVAYLNSIFEMLPSKEEVPATVDEQRALVEFVKEWASTTGQRIEFE